MTQDYSAPFAGTDPQNLVLKTRLGDTLDALRTQFAGATEPTAKTPYQLWFDTSANLVKMRNAGDTDWQILGPLGGNAGRLVTAYTPRVAMAAATYRGLFVAPTAFEVLRFVLVSDTTTSGSSTGVTDWTFQVVNTTGTLNLFATAVSTGGTEITADTAYVLTPDQNTTLAADDILNLVVGVNGAPTAIADWSLIVEGYEIGA
jgi:hypothetical protein